MLPISAKAANHLESELVVFRAASEKSEVDASPFIRAVGSCLGITLIDWDSLFDPAHRHEHRVFIAASLVRLLCVADTVLDDNPQLRAKAVSLIEQVLGDKIYRPLNVGKNDQTLIKLGKLKEAEDIALSQLRNPVVTAHDLDSLGDLRQRFMKGLNSEIVKAIGLPFMPVQFVAGRLPELFRAAESFQNAHGQAVPLARQDCYRAIDAFEDDLAPWATAFTRPLSELSRKLRELVEDSFSRSALSKPADLRVEVVNKKYPFHEEGREITLGMAVENVGSGAAFAVSLEIEAEGVLLAEDSLFIGDIEKRVVVDLDALVEAPNSRVDAIAIVDWQNVDGKKQSSESELRFPAQKGGVPWDAIRWQDPYSLEPVSSEQDLIGRTDILGRLLAATGAPRMGSFWLFGQKRVGKTSIARTLSNHLLKSTEGPRVVYLDTGEFRHEAAHSTIDSLIERLVDRLSAVEPSFMATLSRPQPNGSLSPLARMLDQIATARPEIRIVFILDEFDELPEDLIGRTELANAFFLTLRSISGKDQFSFVLVGGEQMEFVLSSHGDVLNKFQTLRVDYFDRETEWNDFVELVRRPTSEWLEITDESVASIYELTAGNPFFAKLLCREVFSLAATRRDSHVSLRDLEEAKRAALKNVGSNRFQHFWADAIRESGDVGHSISLARRRVLLSLASAKRRQQQATEGEIWNGVRRFGMSETDVRAHLDQFEQRKILYQVDGTYYCKMPFFEEWLVEKGSEEIGTTFSTPTSDDLALVSSSRRPVSSEELAAVARRISTYRGQQVGEEKLRAWLNQFEGDENQRLMLPILQGLLFVQQKRIRELLATLDQIVRRSIAGRKHQVEDAASSRKRGDVLVSYLDHTTKSGGRFARLYADENRIYVDNVCDREALFTHLKEGAKHYRAVILVDDFIGSGKGASTNLAALIDDGEKLLKELQVPMFVVATTGFAAGAELVEQQFRRRGIRGSVHLGDVLGEEDRCFSETSRFFRDPDERQRARDVAWHYGYRLEKRSPIGFDDGQLALTFDDRIPNNSLPILWARTSNWEPLFPRL